MKKLFFLLPVLLVTLNALAEVRAVPLLALRSQWAGFENTIWMEQRTRIGGEAVTGYIQGVGGRDDAIMGFALEQDWDLLEATIGYIDGTPEGKSCIFEVEGNGVVLYTSGQIQSGQPPELVRVPLQKARRLILRIHSDKYNQTAGAAWGAPTVSTGVKLDDLKTEMTIDINGKRTRINPPGGNPPAELNVPLPLKAGPHTYRVQVNYDKQGRKINVVTAELED